MLAIEKLSLKRIFLFQPSRTSRNEIGDDSVLKNKSKT